MGVWTCSEIAVSCCRGGRNQFFSPPTRYPNASSTSSRKLVAIVGSYVAYYRISFLLPNVSSSSCASFLRTATRSRIFPSSTFGRYWPLA
ncbi:hypothetical protein M408DRAFT_265763 [Serendipita vermifera MAFF 305830]|uniref:Uncharacterized protein n=1 Tax=Serendipita vermifera MAFF 305830 TaxID=933852 RepID=A0A0C2X118_SERVB|nr:hypothetical protein M408DRAFT_265763 [Serendipita vermifera MAFF 305830]